MFPPRRPTYKDELVCAIPRYADKLSAGSMQSHNLQHAPARCALHFFHFVKERTSNSGNLSYPARSKTERRNTNKPSAHRPVLLLRPLENTGGAGRDRTDDLRLAKPPLSQLSYSPPFLSCLELPKQTKKLWWVWLDSNQRPPPYQDGALTN